MLTRPTRNALLRELGRTRDRRRGDDACALLAAAEAAARDLGAGLWLVGGGVRDLAAQRRIHDLDLAFSGPTREFTDALAGRAPLATIERTDRFATATARLGESRLDLARLRTEYYVAPGALPEVQATDHIEADLARRDFTVNAIALTLVAPASMPGDSATDTPADDEVVDPYDGIEDLAGRCLRVLHEQSFVDDATRLWRGARTAALYDLQPDATTSRLIEEGIRWLDEISGERLWNELAATARRGRALGTLERLNAWGVLRALHPECILHPATVAALVRRRAMRPARLAAVLLTPLPAEVRDGVMQRLAVAREVRTTVDDTARLLDANPHDLDAVIRLEGADPEARIAARWLDPAAQPAVQRALVRWERTRPALDADALIAAGVPRGPALGRTLDGLRRGRYLGTLSTRAQARDHVRRALDDPKG